MLSPCLSTNSKLREGWRPRQANSTSLSETSLLAKQTTDSPQHTVLLRVVGVVFARNLEERWECGSVGIDSVSYPVGNLSGPCQLLEPEDPRNLTTNMLVDQYNANVFPLSRESLKCLLDGRGIRLGVDDEEVLLRVWGGRDMLTSGISHGRAQRSFDTHAYSCQKQARHRVLL